jgi:hypothetical protein
MNTKTYRNGQLPSPQDEAAEFLGVRDSSKSPRSRPARRSAAKTAVVVLGMHRGRTSSLAGALVKLGARAPKTLMPAHPTNERGFFESLALQHLNDAILASAGSSWDDWRAFNQDWSLSAEAEEFEEKVVATLSEEFGAARRIMVNDPRICRMVPFWRRVFDRAGYAVHVILPVRSPLEVASSLRLRDGFPTSKGLLLWLRHLLDAEAASRCLPRAVLLWPDFLADWRLAMARATERGATRRSRGRPRRLAACGGGFNRRTRPSRGATLGNRRRAHGLAVQLAAAGAEAPSARQGRGVLAQLSRSWHRARHLPHAGA